MNNIESEKYEQPEETRSERMKRLWQTPEFRAKCERKKRNVKPLTEEHKKNISEGMKKYHKLPGIREKRSLISKKNWENTEYRKNVINTLRNLPITEEHRNRMGRTAKANWNDPEIRERIIKKMTGRIIEEETRKKLSESHKGQTTWLGRKHKPETLKKMSENTKKLWDNPEFRDSMTGENHPNWIGGKSFEPYTTLFNKQLKERVRVRDNFICQLCGVPELECNRRLSVHHIDYIKENCNMNNLISLCTRCNSKVNKDRLKWEMYFKHKLELNLDKEIDNG